MVTEDRFKTNKQKEYLMPSSVRLIFRMGRQRQITPVTNAETLEFLRDVWVNAVVKYPDVR